MTAIFMELARAKTIGQKLGLLLSIRPSYFKPVIGVMLGLTDPVCGLNMGQTAENIAKEYGITRGEQDEFALMSHNRAIDNRDKLAEEMMTVLVPPAYKKVADTDNGPREGQTLEALGKLRPFFDRHTGSVTVGNACPITDGAAAVLMMKEKKSKRTWIKTAGLHSHLHL